MLGIYTVKHPPKSLTLTQIVPPPSEAYISVILLLCFLCQAAFNKTKNTVFKFSKPVSDLNHCHHHGYW